MTLGVSTTMSVMEWMLHFLWACLGRDYGEALFRTKKRCLDGIFLCLERMSCFVSIDRYTGFAETHGKFRNINLR